MGLIRYFIRLFRSHGGPNQIAFSAMLGVFVGLTPIWGYHSLIWISLFLLFRFSPLVVAFSALIFKLAGEHLLAPLFYSLGKYLLEMPGTSKFWAELCSLPGIALLELERYAVLGSWTVCVVLSIVVYFISRVVYWGLTDSRMVVACKKSRLTEKLGHFLYGKEEFKGNKLLRVHMWLYMLSLSLISIAAFSLFNGMIIRKGLYSFGESSLGHPISLEQSSVSLLDNKVFLKSLSLVDPLQPQSNLFFVDFTEITPDFAGFKENLLVLDLVKMHGVTVSLGRPDNEFNFSHLALFQKDRPYRVDLQKTDIERLCISEAHEKVLKSGEKTDWLGAFRKWIAQVHGTSAYKKELRLKRLDAYAKKNHLQGRELQEILTASRLEEVEGIVQLPVRKAIHQTAKAPYIKEKPSILCRKMILENGKVDFSLSDGTRESILFRMTLLDLPFPLRFSRSFGRPALPPIKGYCSIERFSLPKLSELYEISSKTKWKKGVLSFSLWFLYSPHQNYLKALCEAEFTDVQIENNGLPETVKGMSAAQFIEGLNQARSFKVEYLLEGDLYDLQCRFPDYLRTMASQGISNLTAEGKEKIEESGTDELLSEIKKFKSEMAHMVD